MYRTQRKPQVRRHHCPAQARLLRPKIRPARGLKKSVKDLVADKPLPKHRAQEEENVPQVLLPGHRPRTVHPHPSPSPPFPQSNPPNLTTSSPPHNRLLDLSSEQLRDVVHARARRRFNRGLRRKPMGLIKKLRKAKQEAKPNEKPDLVKTHLRDMIIVPEMIGSVVGVYSGKEFNQVEIKPEMVGFYLGEFSISYKPVKHGRPGIGATHSSRFIPLK